MAGRKQLNNRWVRTIAIRPCKRKLSFFAGLSCAHTRDFKHWREQQINDDEIETNQLIIRLDKLISNTPKDPVDRKGQQTPCFAAPFQMMIRTL